MFGLSGLIVAAKTAEPDITVQKNKAAILLAALITLPPEFRQLLPWSMLI
jgi:hypothetical protein